MCISKCESAIPNVKTNIQNDVRKTGGKVRGYAIHRPDTYTKTPSESLRWIRMKLSTNTTMRQPIRKTVLISGNLQTKHVLISRNLQTKPLLFQETYKLHISRNLQTKREYSRTYKRNKMGHMMTGNKKYAHLDNWEQT